MMMTLAQAAEVVGLTPRRLRALISAGTLRATKYGKTYVVTERELRRFQALERKPGRPAKR
jgi:excisionase family DNA binding protein